ncbi:hypothetical protein L1887_35845 [Cichorium endivia]|nr:hypothetical protein L1887_35845 [Cichorium endivia]
MIMPDEICWVSATQQDLPIISLLRYFVSMLQRIYVDRSSYTINQLTPYAENTLYRRMRKSESYQLEIKWHESRRLRENSLPPCGFGSDAFMATKLAFTESLRNPCNSSTDVPRS